MNMFQSLTVYTVDVTRIVHPYFMYIFQGLSIYQDFQDEVYNWKFSLLRNPTKSSTRLHFCK